MIENTNVDDALLARDAGEPRASDLAGEVQRNTQKKMDDIKHRVADRLASKAESFKGNGDGGALDPVKQRMSSLMSTAADKLEHFETPDLSNINMASVRDQATEMIRRHPFQAIGVGLGIGLLFGRALKR